MSTNADGAQPNPQQGLSTFSRAAAPDSYWCATDLLLGAGMVIIQPSTERVAVIFDTEQRVWFLPKGRKDVGESMEQAALREAYEESGLSGISFLPLHNGSRAPPPKGFAQEHLQNAEPVFATTVAYKPRRSRLKTGYVDRGCEYLSLYYVGQVPHDTVHVANTGMPDEKYFTTYLLPFDEAVTKLHAIEAYVVAYVHALWKHTQQVGRNEPSSLTRLLPEAPICEVQAPADPWTFSSFSSPAIEDGFWCPSDFLLCAGMVLIQPSTGMVLLMHDEQTKTWSLPRGCKNVNETLAEAALRKSAEQSGYQVEFLPLYTGTRQPYPPSLRAAGYLQSNTEPIMLTTTLWQPGQIPRLSGTIERPDSGGQCFTFYYVGQISPNTVGPGAPHERTHNVELLSIGAAMSRLTTAAKIPQQVNVLRLAWEVYLQTLRIDAH